jgi:type IV pilus assembly protein PilA
MGIFMSHIRSTSSKQNQRGQGMTEYIVIVALIGVAAIGVYQLFGNTIRNQTAAMAQEISGQNGDAARTAGQAQAGLAAAEGATQRNLNNYTNNVAK